MTLIDLKTIDPHVILEPIGRESYSNVNTLELLCGLLGQTPGKHWRNALFMAVRNDNRLASRVVLLFSIPKNSFSIATSMAYEDI